MFYSSATDLRVTSQALARRKLATLCMGRRHWDGEGNSK